MITNTSTGIVVQPLRGSWTLALDPENVGRQDHWSSSQPAVETRGAPVPGTIQAVFPSQHGVAWYWHTFVPSRATAPGERAQFRFHAVDYLADVWLNGQYLGSHEGGETPFTLDATVALQPGENKLAVRVLNPTKTPIDGIMLLETPRRNKKMEDDFQPGSGFNFGGIVQSVAFEIVPSVRVVDLFAQPDWQTGRVDLAMTLRNDGDGPATATVQVTIGPTQQGTVHAVTTLTAELPGGETTHQATLTAPRHRLWSIEDPYLYSVSVTVDAIDTHGMTYHHEQAVRCGFRDFRVVNGYFRLNGKRLWLRSTHTGDHYPIGYYEPADPEMVRRDLVMAKACGLNMVRFIAGMALPEQLDYCDEIGLLVYEENLSAWLLGDSPRMGERFDRSLREMVLRDRNHASLVQWGLLNETYDGPVFRHAVETLPLLRELDPTRTVLLSSGRWDADLSIGSVCNPGSSTWEPVWGREGFLPTPEWDSPLQHKELAYIPGAGDVHIYPQFPHTEETRSFLRTVGHDSQPVFVSEYGVGSLLDVIHILGRYQQTDGVPHATELAVYQTMRDSLEADWERFGMRDVYPFPRDFLRESQRLHARQRLAGLNLMRSNPQIAGYNLTGMLDHAYTGEGIWTFWREWKPGVVDALEDGFSPLRWCLFVEPAHTYAGREVVVEAVLANEDVLQPGAYPVSLRVFGPRGGIWETATTAQLPRAANEQDNPLAVAVARERVTIDGPSGQYTLAAQMNAGGSPAGDRVTFYVSDPAELPAIEADVLLWGIDQRVESWLSGRGVRCGPFAGQAPDRREIILVGDLSTVTATPAEWRALAEAMAGGSTVLFLAPEAFKRGDDHSGWLPLAVKGRCYRFNNWLYHREDVAKPHPIFAGLPRAGILDWDYYGPVIPRYVFEDFDVPEDVAAVFFTTGYAPHPAKTGYASGLIVATYPFGAGRFMLNSLQILNNIDNHPAADRLLLNMIAYAKIFPEGPREPLPEDFEERVAAIGYV